LRKVRVDFDNYSHREKEVVTDSAAWAQALNGIETIYFYPKFTCGNHLDILPVQLIAASLKINFTTGYISRYRPNECNTVASDAANADASTSAFVFGGLTYTAHEAASLVDGKFSCDSLDGWIICR